MKFPVPILLSLASAAVYVVGQAGNEIICESSEGSPFMHHVYKLIDNLNASDDGDLCFAAQIGKKPGHCGNTIKEYSGGGGAAFQMCMTEFASGGEDDLRPRVCKGRRPGEISCAECNGYTHSGKLVANMLEDIAEKCKNPHRAGGRLLIGWPYGGEVRLIRMPG